MASLSHKDLMAIHQKAVSATDAFFSKYPVDDYHWKMYYQKQIEKYSIKVQKALIAMLADQDAANVKRAKEIAKAAKKAAQAEKKAAKAVQ